MCLCMGGEKKSQLKKTRRQKQEHQTEIIHSFYLELVCVTWFDMALCIFKILFFLPFGFFYRFKERWLSNATITGRQELKNGMKLLGTDKLGCGWDILCKWGNLVLNLHHINIVYRHTLTWLTYFRNSVSWFKLSVGFKYLLCVSLQKSCPAQMWR